MTSYSPLACLTKKKDGPVTEVVETIAARHHRTPAQVLLRWNLQGGKAVITTSTRPEGTAQVLNGLFDFELTRDEMCRIDAEGATTPFRAYWTQCPMDSVLPQSSL